MKYKAKVNTYKEKLTPDAELTAVTGSVGVHPHPGPDLEPAVDPGPHTHDGACKLVAKSNLKLNFSNN